LAKCKLHVAAVPEVKWDNRSSQTTEDYIFIYGYGHPNHHLGTSKAEFLGVKSIRLKVQAVCVEYFVTTSLFTHVVDAFASDSTL
jgi:hypothetical protein